jgi:hypothetical protein
VTVDEPNQPDLYQRPSTPLAAPAECQVRSSETATIETVDEENALGLLRTIGF